MLYYAFTWPHRIGGNLKWLRESTNADRKWLKMVFSIANCRFTLPVCNLKHYFNAYRSVLLDSCDTSRLLPIRCDGSDFLVLSYMCFFFSVSPQWVGSTPSREHRGPRRCGPKKMPSLQTGMVPRPSFMIHPMMKIWMRSLMRMLIWQWCCRMGRRSNRQLNQGKASVTFPFPAVTYFS